MSRNHWIVIGGLVLAVAIVLGCLGGLLLGQLAGGFPTQTLAPFRSTDTPTVEPTATAMPVLPTATVRPTPQPSATLDTSGDRGYVSCVDAIIEDAYSLSDDILHWVTLGNQTGDPGLFCRHLTTWQSSAPSLRSTHADCPTPVDTRLVSARGHVESGFGELDEWLCCIQRWCETYDMDWAYEAVPHWDRFTQHMGEGQAGVRAYITVHGP
jgi:hypothetical protein